MRNQKSQLIFGPHLGVSSSLDGLLIDANIVSTPYVEKGSARGEPSEKKRSFTSAVPLANSALQDPGSSTSCLLNSAADQPLPNTFTLVDSVNGQMAKLRLVPLNLFYFHAGDNFRSYRFVQIIFGVDRIISAV